MLRTILVGLGGILVLALVGFVIWAQTGVLAAERSPFDSVRANPAITITDTDNAVVVTPTGRSSTTGLVFIPGAKVDPYAYVYKLSGVVERDHLSVVITKPILNLAFFDQRRLSTFTDNARSVKTWFVGGHSLGGVRACQYAAQGHVRGLVLLGSYCANDLSDSGLRVLSLSGSHDGLSTPQKISQSAHLLPPTTTFVPIEGANHASFGDYGPQDGDGTATISSKRVQATMEITRLVDG